MPCADEHDGEVFALVTVPGTDFPGDDSLTELSEDRCYERQSAYVMDGWSLPEEIGVYYFAPSEGSWSFGDRSVTCVLGREDGTRFSGSLRSDATTLDAHQLAYLEAAEVLNAALDELPESGYFDDDVSDDREWAGEVEEAVAEQVRLLRARLVEPGCGSRWTSSSSAWARRGSRGGARRAPRTRTPTGSVRRRHGRRPTPPCRSPCAKLWGWPPHRPLTAKRSNGSRKPVRWRCERLHTGEKVPA